MIGRVIQSPYNQIHTNIALERSIFDSFDGVDTLFLWSNNPCVVCGRNQNIYSEVDLEYAKQHGIDISRRYSGGGAVYQDMGNINYTIYSTSADIASVLQCIIIPLHDIGVHCTLSGRNDITLDGKKISGFAYYADGDCYMYHGTLLVDVDMTHLSCVLKPSKLKLSHNGISSVASRVCNIGSVVHATASEVQQSIASYHISRGAVSIDALDMDTSRAVVLSGNEWIYGQSPDFDVVEQVRLWDSIYTINIKVHNDTIVGCIVNSDSLDTGSVQVVHDAVMGSKYSMIDSTIASLAVSASK